MACVAHAALHAVLECLGEVVWHAQRHGTPPDAKLYLGFFGAPSPLGERTTSAGTQRFV
jgi:hypothetical protein